MTFDDAEIEIRDRMSETLGLLNHLRSIAPKDFSPLDNLQKSLRGLWLVSLYAAFERATNCVVECCLEDIRQQSPKSINCTPSVHSIIHFSKINSVKDCGYSAVFDRSSDLFKASFGQERVVIPENPLADKLQNVDASTMIWLAELFGAPSFVLQESDRGRLGNLRERRNAVAHGREVASKVGERYTLDELQRIYDVANEAVTKFLYHLKDYCSVQGYERKVA